MKTIICQRCGKECEKKGNGRQKYCSECSIQADIERKARYWKNNKQKINEERRFLVEMIKKEQIEYTNLLHWYEGEVGEELIMKFAIPFDKALLKNHSWAMTRHGHVFLKKETRAAQDELIEKLSEYKGQFKQNKIWLELLVQKPDHKSGDAINFIDRIADAIKVGLDVDDRWFSIRRVDWTITKVNPRIFITVHQPCLEDRQICSICGNILPISQFYKNKSTKLGIGRECLECSKKTDKLKRDAKRKNQNGLQTL
jgi:hypothetical protein